MSRFPQNLKSIPLRIHVTHGEREEKKRKEKEKEEALVPVC
jgi:hypothetical protein